MDNTIYRNFSKQILDLIFSLLLILVLSPIFIAISLYLIYEFKGSPFFVQKRLGYHGEIFKILKFKTMKDIKGENLNFDKDILRITKFGSFLRKSSLDELPQLINVLLGQMSFIGPRPLLVQYRDLFSKSQFTRHEVRPGITGWAQVNGRNSITWAKKFELDIYYVKHLSFFLDLKIFWLTILKILYREGVNQSKDRPMQPFDGTN
ncbi:sugar transferase [Pararhodonellum marinum]|uniref:sugar transferase n=1 Tax=Pararhodonellum marinum TaxID=2755358 RepID=UPI001E5CBF46|nr:sugar transferase [Pararhodonellum marinum]